MTEKLADVQTESQLNTEPNDKTEQIRKRAYELYQIRGESHGHDLEDWLLAEAELLQTEPMKK